MSHEITFVSFCVDIGRGDLPEKDTTHRAFANYVQMTHENLLTDLPLVVFCSDSTTPIPSHRNSDNCIVRTFTQNSIKSQFKLIERYLDGLNKGFEADEAARKVPLYGPLVLLKYNKIVEIVKENPFDSKYFYWIDASFTRGMNPYILKNRSGSTSIFVEALLKKSSEKFLLPYPTGHGRPFGFFWGSSGSTLLDLLPRYEEQTLLMLEEKLPIEELVFMELEKNNPALFDCVYLNNTDYKNDLIRYLNIDSKFLSKK